MMYILVPVLLVLMVMVVVSLVRGISAFMQSTKADLEHDPAKGASPNQLRQNQMMFARIKYQAMAIIVVAVLLAASR